MRIRGFITLSREGFMSRSLIAAVLVVLWAVAGVHPAWATWTRDPSTNLAVSTAANFQTRPTIAADGQGGTIVAWFDNRSGNDDIYVQRISGKGQPLWSPNGVAVCTATGSQSYPYVVPDGAGGAILAWTDSRGANVDIYAQRVSASGVPLWTTDGVATAAATIQFVVPRRDRFALEIHDVAGRRIRSLADGRLDPGAYTLAWDLQDERGARVPNGVYFVQLEGGGQRLVRRITAMR
jgi:hypothetical protein